jgi:hypothetical protein
MASISPDVRQGHMADGGAGATSGHAEEFNKKIGMSVS